MGQGLSGNNKAWKQQARWISQLKEGGSSFFKSQQERMMMGS